MFFRLLLLLCPLFVFSTSSFARTGVVVRLVTGGEEVESPVEAILVNADEREFTLSLSDNGQPPDVTAGDFHFSGSSIIEGEDFTVFVSSNGDKEEVGNVSWPSDVTARDLIITRYEGVVTLETGAGDNQQPPGQPTDPGLAGNGPVGQMADGAAMGAPTAPGEAPSSGTSPARSPNVSFPDPDGGVSAQDDATLYIIGGVLLLILAAVAFFWFRVPTTEGTPSGRPRPVVGNDRVHRMPEPGLLGEGTPSLSDGTSIWVVKAPEVRDFTTLLLASMAKHHRVLVVSMSPEDLPLVHGGPVYRMKSPRPTHVADAVQALNSETGLPIAILVHAAEMESALLNDYADLMPGNVGAAIVVHDEYEGPESIVDVSQQDDGWILSGSGTTDTVRIQSTEWGLSTTVVPKDA